MDYLKFEQPENNKTLEMLRFLNSGKVLKWVFKSPLFPWGSLRGERGLFDQAFNQICANIQIPVKTQNTKLKTIIKESFQKPTYLCHLLITVLLTL
jgi:hypothetical protein